MNKTGKGTLIADGATIGSINFNEGRFEMKGGASGGVVIVGDGGTLAGSGAIATLYGYSGGGDFPRP